jgi:hypothetical protein
MILTHPNGQTVTAKEKGRDKCWESLASLAEATPKTPVQPEIAAEHTCRILLGLQIVGG